MSNVGQPMPKDDDGNTGMTSVDEPQSGPDSVGSDSPTVMIVETIDVSVRLTASLKFIGLFPSFRLQRCHRILFLLPITGTTTQTIKGLSFLTPRYQLYVSIFDPHESMVCLRLTLKSDDMNNDSPSVLYPDRNSYGSPVSDSIERSFDEPSHLRSLTRMILQTLPDHRHH